MINEDMNQVMGDLKSEIFRDLRVCSQAIVVAVHDKQVDVQLIIADKSDGVDVVPPVIKNLYVVGESMPKSGAVGVVLHLDRRNQIGQGELVPGTDNIFRSGGPAHEIGFGVFLPIVL